MSLEAWLRLGPSPAGTRARRASSIWVIVSFFSMLDPPSAPSAGSELLEGRAGQGTPPSQYRTSANLKTEQKRGISEVGV